MAWSDAARRAAAEARKLRKSPQELRMIRDFRRRNEAFFRRHGKTTRIDYYGRHI